MNSVEKTQTMHVQFINWKNERSDLYFGTIMCAWVGRRMRADICWVFGIFLDSNRGFLEIFQIFSIFSSKISKIALKLKLFILLDMLKSAQRRGKSTHTTKSLLVLVTRARFAHVLTLLTDTRSLTRVLIEMLPHKNFKIHSIL